MFPFLKFFKIFPFLKKFYKPMNILPCMRLLFMSSLKLLESNTSSMFVNLTYLIKQKLT